MKHILTGALYIGLFLLLSAALISAITYLWPFIVGAVALFIIIPLLVLVIVLLVVPLCWTVGAIIHWLSPKKN